MNISTQHCFPRGASSSNNTPLLCDNTLGPGLFKRQMLFQWSPNYRRWFSIFKRRTAVVTIYISSVGRILSNGVVFVTVAPTEKELNTNSQAHRMTTVHFLPNILQQLHYCFFCFAFKKLIAPSCFFVILLGSCSHQCTSTCIL